MLSVSPDLSSPVSDGAKQNCPRRFACSVCKQRKVKCNRCDPCSNCVKAGVRCVFEPPAPSRRRKRKATTEGLHARLNRCERILHSYDIKIDAVDIRSQSEGSPVADEDEGELIPQDEDLSSVANPESLAKDKLKQAKLVSQQGKSRYIENDLWSTLTEELNDPSDLFSDGSDEESADPVLGATNPLDGNALLLGMPGKRKLNSLHPQKDIFLKLLEIFYENVNALLKIIHVPSFQKMIDTFCVAPYQVPKSVEALLFTIYLSAVNSLDEDECLQLLGELRKTLVNRYHIAAQQALVNATFLKSTSIVTLQAYYIFLMSARLRYDSSTLLCLTAAAVRIARRLGLHRDGALLGLPPFDAEMRRRLWWQIAFLDCRTADLCGSQPSRDLQCDTRRPLNLNDSDLSPGMIESPKERSGLTEMSFSMIKSYVGEFLRGNFQPMWLDSLRSSGMSLLDKDEAIDKLQDSFEEKILRHCDPLQPLHLLCSIFARITICKLRLSAHNPMRYADKIVNIRPQSESDLIFDNGMKAIGYGNMLHSTPTLQKYKWLIGANFMWDSFIYTLIELRRRKTGSKVDHAWSQIDELFKNYPGVITESDNPLYAAVGIWTLRVWEECDAARSGAAPLSIPDFVAQLRLNRIKLTSKSPDFLSAAPADPAAGGGSLLEYSGVDYMSLSSDMAPDVPYGGVDSFNTSDLMFFQAFGMDWSQLDHMMREPY